MAFYQHDLAEVHHQDYGVYAEQAATFLLQQHDFGKDTAQITDLGCGTGITARLLSEAGHQVTGLDYSEDMLRMARKTAPLAKFFRGSVFDLGGSGFDFPDSDAVLAIGEVFNYLFDEKSKLEALREVFFQVYAALEPGGIFLFDMLMCGAMQGKNPEKRIIENEGWSMFLEITEDTENEMLQREIVLFVPEGKLYRRSKEVHRQKLFHALEILTVLREVGFEVTSLSSYGELQFRPGHQGFLCRKP